MPHLLAAVIRRRSAAAAAHYRRYRQDVCDYAPASPLLTSANLPTQRGITLSARVGRAVSDGLTSLLHRTLVPLAEQQRLVTEPRRAVQLPRAMHESLAQRVQLRQCVRQHVIPTHVGVDSSRRSVRFTWTPTAVRAMAEVCQEGGRHRSSDDNDVGEPVARNDSARTMCADSLPRTGSTQTVNYSHDVNTNSVHGSSRSSRHSHTDTAVCSTVGTRNRIGNSNNNTATDCSRARSVPSANDTAARACVSMDAACRMSSCCDGVGAGAACREGNTNAHPDGDGNVRTHALAEYLRAYTPSTDGMLATSIPIYGRRGLTVTSIVPVGNYALRFVFSDGHDGGIYSYEYLYQLTASPAKYTYMRAYIRTLRTSGKSREPPRRAPAKRVAKSPPPQQDKDINNVRACMSEGTAERVGNIHTPSSSCAGKSTSILDDSLDRRRRRADDAEGYLAPAYRSTPSKQ